MSETTPEPEKANAEISQPLRLRADSLQFLLEAGWWKNAFSAAMTFAPFCLVCGLGIAILNIIVVIGTDQVQQRLGTALIGEQPDLTQLLAVCCVALVVLFGVFLGTFWFLWEWVLHLTAFAHAWISSGGKPQTEQFKSSVADMRQKKQFILVTWLVASVYMLVPAAPLVVMIALKMVTGPEYNLAGGQALVPLPAWMKEPTVLLGAVIACFVLTIVTLGYTMITTAFSAVSKSGAATTANAALLEYFRHFGLVSAIAMIMLVINILISAPYLMVPSWDYHAFFRQNVWMAVAAQVWVGVSSLVLWPITLSPLCHLMTPEGKADVAAVE